MFDKSPLQIIISGPDDEAKPLIDAVNSLLLPQKILIRAKPGSKLTLELLKDIPKDKTKAYVCQNFTCSQPVSTPEELVKLIQKE